MLLQKSHKEANALILVVAVLSILCCLGVAWLRMATLEQKGASNYTLRVDSNLAAQGGLDHAVSRLRARYRLPHGLCDTRFLPSQDAQRDWVYLCQGDMGAGRSMQESQPSFFAGAVWQGRNFTRLTDIDNGKLAVSLKVLDTTSQINLNMQLDPGNSHDDLYIGNINMAFLLNNLSRAIAQCPWYQGGDRDAVNGPLHGLGMLIVEKRAAQGGFRSKWDVVGISDGDNTITVGDVRDIWDFVTVHPLAEQLADPLYQEVRPRAPGGESLPYRRDYRSPVNINTAAWPVLVAVLEGLSDGNVVVSESNAKQLATAICNYRRSNTLFTSRQQLREFLQAQCQNGGCLAADANKETKVDLILAMSDPNVAYRVFNAISPLHQSIDKTQLTYGEWNEAEQEATCYTTEFCFFPYGLFEITSLGEVFDAAGLIVGRAQHYALVRIFDLCEHTTQADFHKAQQNSQWAQKTADAAFISANNLQKESVADHEASQYFGFLEPVMCELALGKNELDDTGNAELCFKVDFNARNDYTLTADKALASALQTAPQNGLRNKSGTLVVPNEYSDPEMVAQIEFVMIPPHRAIALLADLPDLPEAKPLIELKPLSASDPEIRKLLSQNEPLPIPEYDRLAKISCFPLIEPISLLSSQFRRMNDVLTYVNTKIARANLQLQQIIDRTNSDLAEFNFTVGMIVSCINQNNIRDLQEVNAIIALLNSSLANQAQITDIVNQRIRDINRNVTHPIPEQLNYVVRMLNRSNTVLWDWRQKIDVRTNQIETILNQLLRLASVYQQLEPLLDNLIRELAKRGIRMPLRAKAFASSFDSRYAYARSVESGQIGDLLADGVSFGIGNYDRTLCYRVSDSNTHGAYENLPLAKGSLMLWCKLGQQDDSEWQRLFLSTNPYKYVDGSNKGKAEKQQDKGTAGCEIGVQMELAMRYLGSARTLEIRLRRKLYATLAPDGGKEPAWGDIAAHLPPLAGGDYVDYATTLRLSYADGYGVSPHEWYHLAVRWQDYVMDGSRLGGKQPLVMSGHFYRQADGLPQVAHSGPLYNNGLFREGIDAAPPKTGLPETPGEKEIKPVQPIKNNVDPLPLPPGNNDNNGNDPLPPAKQGKANTTGLLTRQSLHSLAQLSPLEASETGTDIFPKRMYLGASPNQGKVDGRQVTLDDIRISTCTNWDDNWQPTRYQTVTGSQQISLFQGIFTAVPDATPGPFHCTVREWDTRYNAPHKPVEVSVNCHDWQYDIRFSSNSAAGDPIYQVPVVDDVVLSYQRSKAIYLEYSSDPAF